MDINLIIFCVSICVMVAVSAGFYFGQLWIRRQIETVLDENVALRADSRKLAAKLTHLKTVDQRRGACQGKNCGRRLSDKLLHDESSRVAHQ